MVKQNTLGNNLSSFSSLNSYLAEFKWHLNVKEFKFTDILKTIKIQSITVMTVNIVINKSCLEGNI